MQKGKIKPFAVNGNTANIENVATLILYNNEKEFIQNRV